MNITNIPKLKGKGINIGGTIVHIIGRGILMYGLPSIGLGTGIGIKEGGRYPTGQYFNPNLTEGPGVKKYLGSSIGGSPFGYGSNPTLVRSLENCFHQHL